MGGLGGYRQSGGGVPWCGWELWHTIVCLKLRILVCAAVPLEGLRVTGNGARAEVKHHPCVIPPARNDEFEVANVFCPF